jgi:IS1 family transposase
VDVRPEKKLPRLEDGAAGDDGTVWVWIAFAAEPRLILALVVGPRTQASADELIGRTVAVLVGRLPLFASDGLDQYGVALFRRWHLEVPYARPGRPGRPRNPARVALPDLRYVQLVKHREGRRLVAVSKRVIYGNPAEIDPGQITTSLVERLNLTLRQENATLTRKTLAFAKDDDELRAHLALQVAYYHFVRPHLSLRRRVPRPQPVRGKTRRRWAKRTPAMAAGITDRVWSLHELLTYPAVKTSSH